MALTDGNGSDMVMPVAPLYGGGYGNGGGFGNSGFGGDWGWIILLLLLGWGNNGWGGGFGGGVGGFAADGAMLYPWMNQAEITTGGFRDAMINDNITSIRDSIGDLSTQLCSCCCDMRDTVNQGFYSAEIAAANRQMANMNQAFAAQTAMAQGFNALGSQFADCCCENRLGIADLKYTVATENCADRAALESGVRDIITNATSNTQAILDKLCALEIDNLKSDNANLRTQLNMANLAASQTAQTAELRQSGATQLNQLVSELRSCPIPAQPVYGSQPIFTCGGNGGCGCGSNF